MDYFKGHCPHCGDEKPKVAYEDDLGPLGETVTCKCGYQYWNSCGHHMEWIPDKPVTYWTDNDHEKREPPSLPKEMAELPF